MASYAGLGDIARDVAVACGRLITAQRPADLAVETKSTPTDAVTEMDKASEALARRLLRAARPADGQLGEEGLDVEGTTGITWVVDPIDGTVNYLYGIPDFAVSVAAVEGDPRVEGAWRPVAGAVYNPLADELFLAVRDAGATLTHAGSCRGLACTPAGTLATSLLGTGFAYAAERRAAQGAVVARVLPHVRDIRRRGSAALDLCHVASGQLDAYYEAGLKPWDYAAAWLVATEAGAVVRGLDTEHPGDALTVAGSAAIVDELRELLRD